MNDAPTLEHIELGDDAWCAFRIDSVTGLPKHDGTRCGKATNQGLRILGAPGIPKSTPLLMALCEKHMQLALGEARVQALDTVNRHYGPRDAPYRPTVSIKDEHDPTKGPRRVL